MGYNASLKSAFQSAHTAFQDIIGQTFTIQGDATEYEGVLDEVQTEKPILGDGMGIAIEEQPRSVYAVASQFATDYDYRAQVGKKLTCEGETWRISNVRYDKIGYQFELEDTEK